MGLIADSEARLVRQLAALAEADPVFRDLYLGRARARLEPLLSEPDYDRLRGAPLRIERGLREMRLAAAARDWPRVKELVTFITGLRQALGAREALLELGDTVYGAQGVALDPFTRLGRTNGDARLLRDRVLGDLDALARYDTEWRDFYEARRRHFGGLSLGGTDAVVAAAEGRPDALEHAALAAAERGEVERLAALVDELMKGASAAQPGATWSRNPAARRATVAGAAQPFTEEVVARASRLGLRSFALRRHARVATMLLDGMRRGALGGAAAATAAEWFSRPGLPAPFRDVLGMLGRQRVVTSAGTPYAPSLGSEHVLVEDFAETEGEPGLSVLLEAMRLPDRWGLSRAAIETSLDRAGPSLIRDLLGLDPYEYRLVCVPFDVYVRVGIRQGWGRFPRWTHFDGYQLLRDGTARALVGGDVRYGGVYDLCSIDRCDDRAGVMVRFAVVRRLRLESAVG